MPQWARETAGSASSVAICAPSAVDGPVGYKGWTKGAGALATGGAVMAAVCA